jgi:hypothetical protein
MPREDGASETEFVTISNRERVGAMPRFVGADPRRVLRLDRDAEFLVELPTGVQAIDFVASRGDCGG